MNANQLYQSLVNAYQQGNYSQVLNATDNIQSQIGLIYEFEFLFGLCALKSNLLESACKHLQNALERKPNDPQATYHLALALNQSGQLLNANKVAAELDNSSKENLQLKIIIAQKICEFDEALRYIDCLLKLAPKDEFALRSKATIYRQFGQPQSAQNCAVNLTTSSVANTLLKSGIAFDQSDFATAEKELLKGLNEFSDTPVLHETLNQLYWNTDNKQAFMSSFNNVISNSKELLFAKVKSLILSKQWQQAEEQLSGLKHTFKNDPTFIHLEAVVLSQNNNWSKASPLFEQAALLAPNNQRFLIDLAVCHIMDSDFYKAEYFLDKAHRIDPSNQELWAYLGFVWQQTNQQKFDWLYGKGDLIDAQLIATPNGYGSLDAYLADLKDYLKSIHISNNTPLDQSVRNGTQTTGNLIYYQHPLIKKFKHVMEQRVQNYINKLPNDPNHPTRIKLGRDFCFSGSWSVLLKDQGHHSNHVHPMGWISGPTYIDIPDQIKPSDQEMSGWVKFGETSLAHPLNKVSKSICPEPGVSVLFPSFMWHGTFPISGQNAERLTISLDVEPLA